MADFNINNVTGLLDVDAFIKNLTLNKQKQIQKLMEKKALIQGKASSINNLLSSVNDLKSYLENLNVESLFKGKKVTVSDSSVLSASVTESAPNLSIKVKPTQLAQEEIRISSQGVSNLDTSLSPASFTLKYWTSDTNSEEVNISFSEGKLQDLVNLINSSQNRVSASIYYDGTAYKLMLSEKDLGASNKETNLANNSFVIEISNGNLPTQLGSLDNNTILQSAKNAKLKVGSDDNEIVSSTNTFKDVVNGLTLTVQKTSDTFIEVKISDSYDKVSQELNNLSNKLNGVIDLVNQLTGKGALFQGNANITQLKSSLFRLTQPLQNLGLINISEEGKYSLNNSNLNSLIENGKISDIQSALTTVKKDLKSYVEALSQSFQFYKNTQDNQIQAMDKKISSLQESLIKEEEKLRLTFSKIEALMAKNEQLRGRLESFIVSLSEKK